jgi:heme-degrading monooxygenase HmoA
MITRVWHGRTSLDNANRYLYFLLTKGTADYQRTKGNLSVKVWRKFDHDCCHFYTVTEWESVEAIKTFAGEDYEKAVYYPEDEGMLLEFEEKVNHYDSFEISSE